MKRTTVMLPDDLAALLDVERRHRDVSAATVVREALERYLLEPNRNQELPFIGIANGGGEPPHARDIDAVLDGSWSHEIDARQGSKLAAASPVRPRHVSAS